VRRPSAAAGSALFFAAAPGTVAGLIPWALTGWEVDAEWWPPLRVLGAVLVVAGAAVLIHAFARFVIEGLGTPAPLAPTEHLVVGGLYRHVRNVMYIAVTAAILGSAALADRYGAQYEEYRRAVPAWWPRLSGGRSPSSSPSRRGRARRRR
jgi:protein-S-isoprenylcysteine O-methyltransferase Ste14